MCLQPQKWLRYERTGVFAVAMALVSFTVLPVSVCADNVEIPHMGKKAHEHFLQYQHSSEHKAFAIAPGGAWSWLTEAVSEEQARKQAIQDCEKHTQQKCVLYALNDRIVFDAEKWSGLWGPYADAATADKATTGTKVGQRFLDISWLDADGKSHSVSTQKGKVVFLHFWGSWCPPCLREFPSLQKLHSKLQTQYAGDIEMKLLQLREPFEESVQWARQYGFADMPLYDSGIKDDETTTLSLKDGSKVEDRAIARVFPSTYVLDRNGLVIFSHNGPVHNWLDYVSFFDHVVKNTRKPGTSTAKKYTGGSDG
jgi:thiol-disulfide isomerase/thioredoxin